MSEDDRLLAVRELYADPILAARTLFADWFPSKMPWVHRGIVALVLQRTDFLVAFGPESWRDGEAEWTEEDLDALVENFLYIVRPDDPDSPKLPLFRREPDGTVSLATSRFLQVMLPRGMSKTTLFNFLICYMVLFKLVRFAVYVSETATHAEQQMANVKRQIETNEAIKELFDDLVPLKSDPERWSTDFIETLNGVAIQCKGRGGQVRGLNVGGARPDIILLDDVEDKESVATDTQRDKTRAWFWGDVYPAISQMEGSSDRIFLLGTLLHTEALMPSIARDPSFITIRFGAMLSSGAALWPHYMTESSWLAKREQYKRMGMLSQFYMEYQSTLHVDADSRKFQPENWKYQIMTKADFALTAEAVDPAISDKKTADATVICVGGMTSRGFIHLLDQWSKVGASPRELVDEYFRLHFKWLPEKHGIEAIAYQAALVHLVREEQFRFAKTHGNLAYFPIIPITHGRAKVERIEGVLSPRYAAGYVTHQRRFPEMESEAIDWPNGKRDHLDSWAMTVTLLDPVASFAGPPQEISLPPSEWRDITDLHVSQCP